ncbi:outer dense fiber protein 3-like protein 2 isoform X2 [Cimex lectularius]|nr:outer dense fiber protein 3-like protein 2 isoform X2 [Cimex lectularius]
MYKLKNLVGYQDHDISKWREPAYSMRTRHESKKAESVPGPKYDIGDVTRFGTKNPLMFSLGRRNSLPDKKEMPGPSAYSPEKFEDLRYRKPPSASLKGRIRDTKGIDMPSPAEYESPGGIGHGHPTMHSAPNAVLTSRRESKQKFSAPAPNTYGSPNVEVVKKSAPMSSIAGRQQDKKGEKVPGPGSYNPMLTNTRSPPAYSFGTKHSKCMQPFKEPESETEVC